MPIDELRVPLDDEFAMGLRTRSFVKTWMRPSWRRLAATVLASYLSPSPRSR